MSYAEDKAKIVALLGSAGVTLVEAGNLLAKLTPDAAPAPVPDPPPVTEQPPAFPGNTIWLSTHIGAVLQVPAQCKLYGAVRPLNSERCDFYMSAGDFNQDGKFDGETQAFKNRCAAFGDNRLAPIAIDWEAYSNGNASRELGGKDGIAKQQVQIAEHLKVITAIRKYCPKALIGIYNTPNCASGYASRLNPDLWWVSQLDSLAPIWAAVDFIAPNRYISYAVTDAANWSDAHDVTLSKNEANLCKSIQVRWPHLKVLPYYQVVYRNSKAAYDQKVIPVREWYNHIRRFADLCGDGAIWWSGTNSPLLPLAHLAAMRAAVDRKDLP